MFLDSHCHLDRLKLEPWGGDLAAALSAAAERGVQRFLCIGIGVDNIDHVVGIAERFPAVYASVGIHPSEFGGSEYHPADPALSGNMGEVIQRLRKLAQHSKVVAIGETGLDFYHEGHDAQPVQEAQLGSFRAHLDLAKELSLPVVVHTRNARRQTIEAIRAANSPASGVLHCFTEDWDMASQALDMGYYISISGIVTFKNADLVREVAKRVPLDRLLLETDSPWLAPIPHRGRPNEPQYVVDVYHYVAELRGQPVEQLAAAVWTNFHRLFPAPA
ncbi:MAG TPA: TatD family hydrolase [Pseudomonadales bacterium]|nr:TatD family hydrolase [Pseudomonadales bacterium]